jgi:hypothetical protein
MSSKLAIKLFTTARITLPILSVLSPPSTSGSIALEKLPEWNAKITIGHLSRILCGELSLPSDSNLPDSQTSHRRLSNCRILSMKLSALDNLLPVHQFRFCLADSLQDLLPRVGLLPFPIAQQHWIELVTPS